AAQAAESHRKLPASSDSDSTVLRQLDESVSSEGMRRPSARCARLRGVASTCRSRQPGTRPIPRRLIERLLWFARMAPPPVCIPARATPAMIRIDFNRLRFLVIEDNAHMRRILRTLLYGF